MSSELKQWALEILLVVLAVLAVASAPSHGAVPESDGRLSTHIDAAGAS